MNDIKVLPYLLHEAHHQQHKTSECSSLLRSQVIACPPTDVDLAAVHPCSSQLSGLSAGLRVIAASTHPQPDTLRTVSQPLPRCHSVLRLDLDIPSSPLDIPLPSQSPDSSLIVTQPSTSFTAFDTNSLPGITLQSLSSLSLHILEVSAPPHSPLLFQPQLPSITHLSSPFPPTTLGHPSSDTSPLHLPTFQSTNLST